MDRINNQKYIVLLTMKKIQYEKRSNYLSACIDNSNAGL
jgi:hypothetical protein